MSGPSSWRLKDGIGHYANRKGHTVHPLAGWVEGAKRGRINVYDSGSVSAPVNVDFGTVV